MPRATSNKHTEILAASVGLLKASSLTKWSIDSCADRAHCVKGLVIHYFDSRAGLLAASARELGKARAATWRQLLGSGGVAALDRLWDALVVAATDGSGRALLELRFAGVPSAGLPAADTLPVADLLARALEVPRDDLPVPAAIEPILEGYLIALIAGAEPEGVREAFFRYWLTFVR